MLLLKLFLVLLTIEHPLTALWQRETCCELTLSQLPQAPCFLRCWYRCLLSVWKTSLAQQTPALNSLWFCKPPSCLPFVRWKAIYLGTQARHQSCWRLLYFVHNQQTTQWFDPLSCRTLSKPVPLFWLLEGVEVFHCLQDHCCLVLHLWWAFLSQSFSLTS